MRVFWGFDFDFLLSSSCFLGGGEVDRVYFVYERKDGCCDVLGR